MKDIDTMNIYIALKNMYL